MSQRAINLYTKKTIDGITRYLTNNGGPGMANLNEITPNIYCSDYDIACTTDILSDNRIYTVISLGDTKSREVLAAYKKLKIKNYQFDIADNPNQNLADVFLQTYDLILDAVGDGRKVLVHCNAGVSRAPSVIIAYLMRRSYLISYNKYMQELQHIDLIEEDRLQKLVNLCRMDDSRLLAIIKFVKRVRPCIAPNPGFVQQLFLYERFLKSQIAQEVSAIQKRDDDEIQKRKLRELDNEEDPDQETPKEKIKLTPKPVMKPAIKLDYIGKDKLSDLADLEISDDEPSALEETPVKTAKIVAVGDSDNSVRLDNSDLFDQLPDFDNNDDVSTIDSNDNVKRDRNDDDFDLDF